MKTKNLLLVVAIVCAVDFFFASCEKGAGDNIKKSKVECKIDGDNWETNIVNFTTTDSTLSVQGINDNDTLAFEYEISSGRIIIAKFGNYSMIYAGMIEDGENLEKEASGKFEFTLYDNFVAPGDSVVITEGVFLIMKH